MQRPYPSFARCLVFACILSCAYLCAHRTAAYAQRQAQTAAQTAASIPNCITSFPLQTRHLYLPIHATESLDIARTPATERAENADIFRRINGTVPLGDQLGDMSQYYSQVAPSLHSALVLENSSTVTESADITLYGDNGYVARRYQACQLAPNSLTTWEVQQKQMVVNLSAPNQSESILPEMLCATDGRLSQNGAVVEPVLHGIYHAEIVVSNRAAINGRVIVRTDRYSGSQPLGEEGGDPRNHAQADFPPDGPRNAQSLGVPPSHGPKTSRHSFLTDKSEPEQSEQFLSIYPLVDATEAPSVAEQIVHIPNMIATRNGANRWDTELVVQNMRDAAVELTFRLCDAGGQCFANNRATLRGKERRIFLASHLYYSDDPRNDPTTSNAEELTQRVGWYAVSILARAIDNVEAAPQIAVVSNNFKQVVEPNESRPKAELGSSCLLSSSHAAGEMHVRFAVELDAPLLLRVYNPSATQNEISFSMLDEDGAVLENRTVQMNPGATISWDAARLRQEFGALQSSEAAGLEVMAQERIVAFLWQNGVVVPAVPMEATTALSSTLAAPLLGAPTLPFRWDRAQTDPASERSDQALLSRFGLGETVPGHELRPEWVRRMNWYNWFALRDSCNQPVGPSEDYSTYMALWRGLGRCTGGQLDRSCINSEERLQRIRNYIPSSCAGRPLFLANEPDVNARDFMSYAELGRVIYVFRDWPGDLYSPTFGGTRYDRVSYPSEATPWCETAVSVGVCPQASGCGDCIRDGVDDGVWDPYDIHLQGLERYFQQTDLWMSGRSWPIESIVDGLSLHFYTDYDALANDVHWRAPLLQRYRDRADEAGWPIIVKEYGFITWPYRDGSFLEISRCDIVNRLDNARRVLQTNLGGYTAEHNQNPFKLFWFHAGCNNPNLPFYEKLCLFETATELSMPVGARWYEDAITQSADDTEGTCSEIRLPVADTIDVDIIDVDTIGP